MSIRGATCSWFNLLCGQRASFRNGEQPHSALDDLRLCFRKLPGRARFVFLKRIKIVERAGYDLSSRGQTDVEECIALVNEGQVGAGEFNRPRFSADSEARRDDVAPLARAPGIGHPTPIYQTPEA